MTEFEHAIKAIASELPQLAKVLVHQDDTPKDGDALSRAEVLQQLKQLTQKWVHLESTLPEARAILDHELPNRTELTDAFQTFSEGYAVARVSNQELKRFGTQILETQMLPIIIDAKTPALDLSRASDGILGRVASDLIDSLAWRVWRWVYWWQNPLGDARTVYKDEWSVVGPKLELIAACGKEYRQDLRWRFISQDMTEFRQMLTPDDTL